MQKSSSPSDASLQSSLGGDTGQSGGGSCAAQPRPATLATTIMQACLTTVDDAAGVPDPTGRTQERAPPHVANRHAAFRTCANVIAPWRAIAARSAGR